MLRIYSKNLLVAMALLVSAMPTSANDDISTMSQFESLLYQYYLEPKKELVASAFVYAEKSGLVNNENAKLPLMMSFSCIASLYDDNTRRKWKETVSKLEYNTSSLFTAALEHSPEEHLGSIPLSPAKNDMNWACFMATGKEKYIENILDTLQYLNERSDLNKFLTAASAKWSLSSNAVKHAKVRKYLGSKKLLVTADEAGLLSEILTTDPTSIKEDTVLILKENKENWRNKSP